MVTLYVMPLQCISPLQTPFPYLPCFNQTITLIADQVNKQKICCKFVTSHVNYSSVFLTSRASLDDDSYAVCYPCCLNK